MVLDRTSFTTFTNIVSLATAKAHLRVDHSADDALIGDLIKTAGAIVEEYTGTYLSRCTFRYYMDRFQDVDIHVGPKADVTYIEYKSTAGTYEPWTGANWQEDLLRYPKRLRFKQTPSDVKDELNAIRITGEAGWSTVPAPLKSAMLLIIGHLYEHRKDVLVGIQSAPLVHGAKYLMDKFKHSTI